MKVLIPVEDGLFIKEIVEILSKHSWPARTEFEFMHVVDADPSFFAAGSLYCCDTTRHYYEDRSNEANTMLAEHASALQAVLPEAKVSTFVMQGNPKVMILQKAKSIKADFIVMGSHSRKGLSNLLLGSVANAVLSHASCCVIIVKSSATVSEVENKQTATSAAS